MTVIRASNPQWFIDNAALYGATWLDVAELDAPPEDVYGALVRDGEIIHWIKKIL